MFDDVIRELRRLGHGVTVSIDLPDDEEEYFDRRCPNPECGAGFKVLSEDWSNKISCEVVYCPICRFEADPSEWNTPGQQRYLEKAAEKHMSQRLDNALTRNARRFNQQQPRSDLLQISMSYRPSPLPILLPVSTSELMRQKSACEKCGCRYSSIGAAFFCPACGHNSAVSTFDAAVQTVRKTIGSVPAIREALIAAENKDTAEDSIRHICENGLVNLVSAFQRFAEAHFESLPNSSEFNPRPNVFQNLDESSDLWRSAIGSGYDDMMTGPELSDLKRFFQQRHILAHKGGLVDQGYLDRSSDHRYSVGQRLVVDEQAVLRLGDLVFKLVNKLREYGGDM